MDADPDQTVDPAQPAQQLREPPLAVQVKTVAAGVLRDDDQLLDAVAASCSASVTSSSIGRLRSLPRSFGMTQ